MQQASKMQSNPIWRQRTAAGRTTIITDAPILQQLLATSGRNAC
jgi:hypothetical protein